MNIIDIIQSQISMMGFNSFWEFLGGLFILANVIALGSILIDLSHN